MFFPTFEFFKTKIKHLINEKENEEMLSTISSMIISKVLLTILSFPLEISKVKIQSGIIKKK